LLLKTHLKRITLCEALRKEAAGNQGNMVKEVEDGNVSVEEWCDADGRNQQKYSLKKNCEKQCL